MPSVGNPNGPSKNRLAARASKAKKQRRKRSSEPKSKIAKADTTRGARAGLLPTSGPRAKISAKKARKLEKKMGYALKRKMEADGEEEMKGELPRLCVFAGKNSADDGKMRLRQMGQRMGETRRLRWRRFNEGTKRPYSTRLWLRGGCQKGAQMALEVRLEGFTSSSN